MEVKHHLVTLIEITSMDDAYIDLAHYPNTKQFVLKK